MSNLPEIKNPKYHEMDFGEVEKIRESVASGNINLIIDDSKLLLYLNQMERKYSTQLKWIQNISVIGFVGMIVFIFINWTISPFLFVASIVVSMLNRKLAKKYILKQCSEDKVFLKFALAVGLANFHP
ncbi:hypothetical protein L6255_04425 [Candidatus Parcubacteria bacterium]|nr:hypothetical protein [Patescibacteria group bacterium]MCG2689653.1 hypothetical protein [Candidatus Parcubacteria bacterium]